MEFTSVQTLVLIFGILESSVGVKFLVTVPRQAYYDTELKALVTASGITPGQKEKITLKYKGHKDTSKLLNSTTLEFTEDGLQEWRVMFTWNYIQSLEENGVILLAQSGDVQDEKEVIFAQKFGYIFIQTDKPVYTPRQKVMFRVIAMDEDQKLSSYSVRIDILNDKLVVVDRIITSAEDAFKAKVFELPKDTPPGIWSICANFEGVNNVPGAKHTARFEVKEYVLPRISTILSIDPDVITNKTQWITANVISKYVYGRPVEGSVEMKFGVWHPNGLTDMLQFSITGQLGKGKLSQDISMRQLFPDPKDVPVGKQLYTKVTVIESGTLEEDVFETCTLLSETYYKVDFSPSKKYFKPGFPYTLKAQVSSQSSRPPATGVQLHVNAIYYDENGSRNQGGTYQLNKLGMLEHTFNIPAGIKSVKFEAVVLDPKIPEYVTFTYDVQKFASHNNEYIHISLVSHIKKNTNGVVLLRYTIPRESPSGSSSPQEKITVLVLSKGHIVFTTTVMRNLNGQSLVQLPSLLYAETSPSMRVVAYYTAQAGESVELEPVADSLFVDTQDACLEEVFIRNGAGVNSDAAKYKPQDNYILKVEGGPNMNVGLVAVDKAVLLLNDKQTLTRGLLFSELGSHDMGTGIADGDSVEKIFENSGLHYLLIDTKADEILLSGVFYSVDATTRRLGSSEGDAESRSPVAVGVSSPPQTVRRYFPESWLFEEWKLPRSGNMDLNLTLPDSVTTWSFLAVGLSTNKGFCVSEALEQAVEQLFFADVRLPYKASRLEEIKIKILIYNYHTYEIKVDAEVIGSEGLCFANNISSGGPQKRTSFTVWIGPGQARAAALKVIPLRTGDIPIRVELKSQNEIDIVEKSLHVVAEGQRIIKSITFVLDPEAKHLTFSSPKKNRKFLFESAVVRNLIDPDNKEQKTTIDLALPKDVIRGTENCRISAFGDLMGDIITHAVIESKNLINAPLHCAEEVMGDLAPVVHALSYVDRIDLKIKNLRDNGKKFVKNGVMSLLNYRNDNFSFRLKRNSKPATWFTAFALKTLCYANALTFIDRENLIRRGFSWLNSRIYPNGTMKEEDWRLMKNSIEYNILLSAEVLISVMECKNLSDDFTFSHNLAIFLGNSLNQIKDPMVLAKVTYALMLFNPRGYHSAVGRLMNMKKRNKFGHWYWSQKEETFNSEGTSFWRDESKAHASAIEATAYALLVFIRHGRINVDAVADWLVWQRNPNGAFVSVMDSTAAIQALSAYSLQKYKLGVNLHCNISSDRQKDLSYSFNFTQENALIRKSLNNVAVGQVLDVLTRGQGLGQMQVNVEYNIPIEKNKKCDFKITVTVSKTQLSLLGNASSDSPYCKSCSTGCFKSVQEITSVSPIAKVKATPKIVAQMRVRRPKQNGKSANRKLSNRRPRTQNARQKTKIRRSNPRLGESVQKRRQTRDVWTPQDRSRRSICVYVCLRYLGRGPSEPTEIKIEMLTGYKPVKNDINWIKKLPYVTYAEYEEDEEVIRIQYTQLACTEETCFGFRAVDEEEADRLMPASVEVKYVGRSAPHCVTEYKPPPEYISLKVYCANLGHQNKGECRCFSGLCSVCKPMFQSEVDLHSIKQFGCKSPIGYQLQIDKVNSIDRWAEIDARVISLNKTGSDNITAGSVIKLRTPNTCRCPVEVFGTEKLYLLSSDVERLLDANGKLVFFYHLDEKSQFLRVSEPRTINSAVPSVPHFFVQMALSESNTCED